VLSGLSRHPGTPAHDQRSGAFQTRSEAAAALEGVLVLNLAPEDEILTLLALLDRLCAMLTRLGHMGDSPRGAVQPGQRGRER